MATLVRLVPSTSTTAPEMKVGNTILSFSAKTKKTPQQMSVPTRQAPMRPPNPYAGAMSSAGDTNTMLHTMAMGTLPPTGPIPSV